MMTIKEKANEYAKMKHTNKNLIDIVSWDFEAGANYVLDEIEKIVKYDKDPRCIEVLKERIWRLKQ